MQFAAVRQFGMPWQVPNAAEHSTSFVHDKHAEHDRSSAQAMGASVVSLGPVSAVVSAAVELESAITVVLESASVVLVVVELVVDAVMLVVTPPVSVVSVPLLLGGRHTLAMHSSPGPHWPRASHSQTAIPGVQSSGMHTPEGVHSRSGSQTSSRHSQPKLPGSQSSPVVIGPEAGSVKHPIASATRVATPSMGNERMMDNRDMRRLGGVHRQDSSGGGFLPR